MPGCLPALRLLLRIELLEVQHGKLEPRDAPDPRAHLDRRLALRCILEERARGGELACGAVRDAEQERADGELVGRVW